MSARDPVSIIDAILPLVPNEPQWQRLRLRLASVRETSFYQPPEGQWIVWQKLAAVLTVELGSVELELDREPRTDWQRAISDIIEGRQQVPTEGTKS